MASYIFRCRNSSCENLDDEMKVVKSMKDPNPSCELCKMEMNQVYKNSGVFILKGNGWSNR